MKEQVSVLHLPFSTDGREAALQRAHRLIAAGRAAAIYTPNAEMAVRARRDPAFFELLCRADMLLADGVGITAAARLKGVALPRLPGIDFAEALLLSAPPEGYRLFLLGGRPGVARRAAAALKHRFPRLRICGVQDGYYAPEMEHAVAAAIRAARPQLLLVCLGSPRQEQWIDRHRLPCLSLGLGGALDVWAGEVKRAPVPVRRAGMEWLWRLAHDPRRLRRSLALPEFALRVLWELGTERTPTAHTPSTGGSANCQKNR